MFSTAHSVCVCVNVCVCVLEISAGRRAVGQAHLQIDSGLEWASPLIGGLSTAGLGPLHVN